MCLCVSVSAYKWVCECVYVYRYTCIIHVYTDSFESHFTGIKMSIRE